MERLKYDLHIHSCLSPCADDDMTPANIAGMAKVIGLDLVALTDHGTCRNCPAFAAAAEQFGINVLFGMELTTAEEVHVLCYFASPEDAMAFDAEARGHLPDIPNQPAYFGNQLIFDRDDRICGTEEKLLISATDIPFDGVWDLVSAYRGVMVPAHIDKPSTSLLSNLGFVPDGSRFTCVEVKDPAKWPGLVQMHPYLGGCRVLSSSDAHTLGGISEPVRFLETEDASPRAVLRAIEGKASFFST